MCSKTLPPTPESRSSPAEYRKITVAPKRDSDTLQPTFEGYVNTTFDALILFEACLGGHLKCVPRRPHDRERNALIRSGCVFIYAESASGIKRWTDGVNWSPCRSLGDFLVYRELDKPFPPGKKKTAKNKRQRRAARPGEPYPRPDSTGESYSPTTPQSTSSSNTTTPTDAERQLIGSLIDSYDFKPDGLVKKTFRLTLQDVTHHLVSYYNMDDVTRGLLQPPSQVPAFSAIEPRQELTSGIHGGYRPMNQQNYSQISNYYHYSQQQGASAGYAGPLMNGSFIPQMAVPSREGRYNGYNQQTYRNHELLTSSILQQPHLNSSCIILSPCHPTIQPDPFTGTPSSSVFTGQLATTGYYYPKSN